MKLNALTCDTINQDCAELNCNRRVRIEFDRDYDAECDCIAESSRIWSTDEFRYSSDEGASRPFSDDGTVKPGLVVFRLDLFEHSGRVWKIRRLGARSERDFDLSVGFAYLYFDKESVDSAYGAGQWDRLGLDGNREDHLFDDAKSRVERMNLIESGSVYGYVVEKGRKYKTTFEDGSTEEGTEWTDEESCWGFVTERLDDIDFPRTPDIPVYLAHDTTIMFDEYTVPELA